MICTKKAVASLLSGVALTFAATQAGAVSVTNVAENFTATHTISDINGGNITPIGTSLNNAGGHVLNVAAGGSATYHDYTTVKSWADLAIDLGWMHNVDWVQVNVSSAGTYKIKDEVIGYRNAGAYTTTSTSASTGTVTNTSYQPIQLGGAIHPAFTVWSLSGNFATTTKTNNPISTQSPLAYGYVAPAAGAALPTNSNMGFNQVATPATGNNSQFLMNGNVNGIVGYSNSGFAGWYNGNGDYVGSGTAGASSGTNAATGFMYTDLSVNLAAGSYLIAVGGSCVNLVNCGPTQAYTKVATLTNGTSTTTSGSGYATGWHELTVTSVPVPGAVWLFGSAMAGLIGFGRRKAALTA